MITAKNYAAQCAKGVAKFAAAFSYGVHHPNPMVANAATEYLAATAGFIEMLEDGQHFVMPDDGRVFEDGLRGLRNITVKLPFRVISLEYHATDFDGTEGHAPAPKRVITAMEVTRSMLPVATHRYADKMDSVFPNADSTAILVLSAYADGDAWEFSPMSWLLPEAWDCGSENYAFSQIVVEGGRSTVFGLHSPVVPSLFEMQPDEFYQDQVQNMTTEVIALLEFLEALSCTNVSTAIHQEASKANPKRARQGKTPIWETKVLTIDVPGSRTSGQSKGGTHSSPRQHLRRGHIRRLTSGNIWVNSCVVGSPENGNVEKNYNIRKAA